MQLKEAFISTIKANEGILYKVTKIYAKDLEDQKDLYQEIVYQLWKSFESFSGRSKRSTWMYRVALNTSIAHLNKEKKTIASSSGRFNFENVAIYEERDTLFEERLDLMYSHIRRLNVIEKGLILLFLEGKSYDEIAAITGFTNTNVGTRLARIKKKLKSNILK